MRSNPGPIIELSDPALRFRELPGVYPAREDTFLLLRTLIEQLENGKGMFLEMGCGTGLCSVLAGIDGWHVHASDRNPRALDLTRNNLKLNGCLGRMFLSDLFWGIPMSFRDSFDIICFNPPYLIPSGTDLPFMERCALEDTTEESLSLCFIREGSRFLVKNGSMFIVTSPYTRDILKCSPPMKGIGIKHTYDDDLSDEGLSVLELSRTCE